MNTTASGSSSSSSNDEADLGTQSNAVTNQFLSLLYMDVFLTLLLLIIYSCIRRRYPNIELRRTYKNIDSSSSSSSDSHPITHPDIDTNSWWTWIRKIYGLNYAEFYYHSGIDSLVFRMFLETCISICLYASPFGFVILIPVYATGTRDVEDPLSAISAINLDQESKRLWATVIGQYYIVLVVLYFLTTLYLKLAYICDHYNCGDHYFNDFVHNINWRSYLKQQYRFSTVDVSTGDDMMAHMVLNMPCCEDDAATTASPNTATSPSSTDPEAAAKAQKKQDMRSALMDKQFHQELSKLPKSPSQFTIVIQDLPQSFRNKDKLFKLLNDFFPDQISQVTVVPDLRLILELEEQVTLYERQLQAICEKEQINYEELIQSQDNKEIQVSKKPTKVVMRKLYCCGLCGVSQDIIAYFLKEREKALQEIRTKINNLSPSPTAFVQFESRHTANLCLSAPIRFGVLELKITKAPRPQDVLWKNLARESYQYELSKIGVNVGMVLLLLFWSIPATAIQGLANLSEIFQRGGIDLNHILGTVFVSWLEGFLSIVLLGAWLSLVPLIVDKLSSWLNLVSFGDQQTSNLKKFFDCLLVMLVLVTAISGTILKNLEELQWEIDKFIEAMAYGLSQMSVYFMMFLMHQGLFGSALELYRLDYWTSKWLFRSEDNNYYFAWGYPTFMIGLILCVTYGAMSPLIWIIGLVYFITAYFVCSYHLSMSYVNTNEIGLHIWPAIFNRLIFGIEIGNITVLVFVSLSEGVGPSILMVFLIILVFWVWRKMHRRFERLFYKRDTRFAHQSDELSIKHRKEKEQEHGAPDEQKTTEEPHEIIGIGGSEHVHRQDMQNAYVAPVLKKYNPT